MAQYNFGTGLLTFKPQGLNVTPIQIGVLQDVSINMDSTIKELMGSYRVAMDAAVAELKITGTAKYAQVNGGLYQQVLAGSVATTGGVIGAINEVATIPTTPFTVTVSKAVDFVEDLGVIDTRTNTKMVRVASAPATGQYSVDEGTGVYTFASADTLAVVWISYSYDVTAGTTVTYSNQLMGSATTFGMTLYNTYKGKHIGYKLYACMIPKLALAARNTEYTEMNLDYSAFAADNGLVISAYSSE